MRVHIPKKRGEVVKVISSGVDETQGYLQGNSDTQRSLHWDIQDAARNLSWVRAALSIIGRSLVGPGYTFRKVDDYEDEATDEALKKLKMFYGPGAGGGFKKYKNFKDYYTTSGKFFATAISMKFGAAAWEIKRDKVTGEAVDFDYIPGYVTPNVDPDGSFMKPAFKQYLSMDGMEVASWDNPGDIVFFARPDFGGYSFSSDLEALVNYTLPSDIYAALSWLGMHKNRNAPLDGYWETDKDMTDTDFRKVEAVLRGRMTGAKNYGRAPIVARGNLKFNRIQRSPEEAPYIEGRKQARQEISAVTGVPGTKMGVSGEGLSGKDAKRDYYETEVEPLQQAIEEATYEQIHVREFGIRGWKLHFNNPAFLNEVEQASVDRTYWNIGVDNSNEIRQRRGQKSRKNGDTYYEPANMIPVGGKQVDVPAQGDEPGTSDSPIASSESDPSGQKPRPVRTDEQSLQDEIRKWKTAAVKHAKKGNPIKEFESNIIPSGIKTIINSAVEMVKDDPEKMKEVFRIIEEQLNGAD